MNNLAERLLLTCFVMFLVLGMRPIHYLLLMLLLLVVLFLALRVIYHCFNPEAKRVFLEKKSKKAEELRQKKAKEYEELRQKEERAERERRLKEEAVQKHRDSDQQSTPYIYQIARHGNEALAIRYGIANQERVVKPYWYHAKGGVQKRNPDRDRFFYEPAKTIRLQKTKKVGAHLYEVLLKDYRDRKARAVIEVGTEYVKTFYPLDDSWFKKYADLEQTLKGSRTFTLKELATFHVNKTVGT